MTFIKEAIAQVVSGRDLSESEAKLVMSEVMDGLATQIQISALLTALRMKGETVEEIAAFAMSMKEHAVQISPQVSSRLTDTCGTGGDALKTLNISTIASLVISGAGTPIAKHGNRSFTSMCGSADLLEALGVNINAEPERVRISIEQAGIGFLFAPVFHPAFKNASEARKGLGIRTVFNLLGPLTNPAGAKAQLIGVYEDTLVRKIVYVLKKIGVEDALVVHGLDGLDEISIVGKTHVARLQHNEIHEEILTPDSFGLTRRKMEEISAPKDAKEHSTKAVRILANSNGSSGGEKAVRDMILANSSAGLVVSGKAKDYFEGVEIAKESLESGRAFEKLNLLVKYSGGDASKIESLLVKL